jgi:microcin C transport system substrate-binding protein
MRLAAILLLAALAMPAAAQPRTDAPAAQPRTDAPAAQPRTDALSLVGEPRLPVGFTHFPFVNPNAPRGGEVTLAAIGTFDSFNPFILRGTAAGAVGQIWDPLMRGSADEPSTEYAHLAERVEVAPDGTWVAFTLRAAARWHDGRPITAGDVAWTFETLRTHGRPFYRAYWGDVTAVEPDGERRVVFRFRNGENRELPQILGQLTVLPRHWFEGRDFTRPLTEPPLGSSAYRIEGFEMGRSVTLRRVPGWWGEDIPTQRGMDNFDVIRTVYFRDPTVAFEAFKAGQVDFRLENIARQWATAYDFPAVQRGLVRRETFRRELPTGMQAFGFNARREPFNDPRVREALSRVFDFEWLNANIFFGQYTRTSSYFSNSELASSGLPTGEELALLERFRGRIPDRVFTQPFQNPVTDGSGTNREGLRAALDLLRQAGWTVRDRRMVNAQGRQMSFEIVLDSPSFERVALPYAQWLQRLGIDARVRTVEAAQYQRITDEFDFDMTLVLFGQSESPGNEQRDFWSCEKARQPGSRNLMGICSPAIDELIELIISAPDRASLITRTRALDRVLLHSHYVVPHWYSGTVNVAFWDRFGIPDYTPRTGIAFEAWWIDQARAAATDAARRAQ